MSDLRELLDATDRIPAPATTAAHLAAARQYVYLHCPPQWVPDVIAALDLHEGTEREPQ